MANSDYRRQVEELVRRCEDVGWQVVKTGKNYSKVDTRHGIFMIPSTPGSYNSVRNTIALADRHGLSELEEKLKQRRERDRLEKIRADRRANDAQLDRIMNGNGDVSTAIVTTVPPLAENLGLYEDGTPIAAVGPALIQTPVMDKPAPMRFGEELLLADGRVVYRCTYQDQLDDDGTATTTCHRSFDKVIGLRSHIGFHTRPVADRPAHHQVVPPHWSEETRAAVIAASTQKSNNTQAAEGESREVTEPTPTEREQVITRLEELAGTMFDLGGKLIDVRNGLIAVADAVKKLPDQVEPDPELVAKAAKFDALRSTLGGLIQ